MVESFLPPKPNSHAEMALDTETFGQCIMCFEVINGEVWMCPCCSSIQCFVCLQSFFQNVRNNTGCPKCRASITQSDYVRCRPIENLISKIQNHRRDFCQKHETKKYYFCMPCKEAFCPICLLEDNVHNGHQRQNLKEIAPRVKARLNEMNEGLLNKKQQIEQSMEHIEREMIHVNDELQKVTIPEIQKYAKLLEKAAFIDKRVRVGALGNIMKHKVQWSLKEIDSLQWKIQQLIDEEAIIEYISHEKMIEHQYRSIRRMQQPNYKVVHDRTDLFGIHECKDFNSKKGIHMKETSMPIAVDGQLWLLEIDLNSSYNGYLSVFLINQTCHALRIDPPPIVEIKVIVVHPTEPHSNIKKTLPTDNLPLNRYRFLKIARVDDLRRLGFIDTAGSLNFRYYVKRSNIKKRLAAALERERNLKQRIQVSKVVQRAQLKRSRSYQNLVSHVEKCKAFKRHKRHTKSAMQLFQKLPPLLEHRVANHTLRIRSHSV